MGCPPGWEAAPCTGMPRARKTDGRARSAARPPETSGRSGPSTTSRWPAKPTRRGGPRGPRSQSRPSISSRRIGGMARKRAYSSRSAQSPYGWAAGPTVRDAAGGRLATARVGTLDPVRARGIGGREDPAAGCRGRGPRPSRRSWARRAKRAGSDLAGPGERAVGAPGLLGAGGSRRRGRGAGLKPSGSPADGLLPGLHAPGRSPRGPGHADPARSRSGRHRA